MEQITFKKLILNLKSTLEEIQLINNHRKLVKSSGEWQKYNIRLIYLKRKLKAQKENLAKFVHGNVTTVTYQLTNKDTHEVKKFDQTFVNISKQDIYDILNLLADTNNADIKILELKEIPTGMKEL